VVHPLLRGVRAGQGDWIALTPETLRVAYMRGVRFIRPGVHDAVVNFFAERDFTMQEARAETLRRWTTIERAGRAEAAVHGVPDDADGSGGEARTSGGDDGAGSGNGRNSQGGGGNNGGGGGAGGGQALSEQRIIAMIAELHQGLRARNDGGSSGGNAGGNRYGSGGSGGGGNYSGGGGRGYNNSGGNGYDIPHRDCEICGRTHPVFCFVDRPDLLHPCNPWIPPGNAIVFQCYCNACRHYNVAVRPQRGSSPAFTPSAPQHESGLKGYAEIGPQGQGQYNSTRAAVAATVEAVAVMEAATEPGVGVEAAATRGT
jgi:hypothetical protein